MTVSFILHAAAFFVACPCKAESAQAPTQIPQRGILVLVSCQTKGARAPIAVSPPPRARLALVQRQQFIRCLKDPQQRGPALHFGVVLQPLVYGNVGDPNFAAEIVTSEQANGEFQQGMPLFLGYIYVNASGVWWAVSYTLMTLPTKRVVTFLWCAGVVRK